MQPVPRIFVSATSRDLKTARTLVSEGLRRMECLPIVQDDFPPDYKSVREMLVAKIKTCNAVVHLAGFYYGAEPQPTPPDPERRSFTQMEYEIAMELGLPCYVFLCGEKFPFDEHDPEPEEKRALQMAHRERLLSRDELFYEFDTREDLNSRTRELQLSVESLRDELAKERKRRRITMVVSAAALLVALVGGIFLFSKTKTQEVAIEQTAGKLDEQGKLIAMLLAEQERLRARGSSDDLAGQAERNVARQENISQEDVRMAVSTAITSAEADVAKAEGADRADALKRLGDAQLAAGLENEAVASYRKRLEVLDRSEDPAGWAGTVATLGDLVFSRGYGEEAPKMVREALAWAEASDALGAEHPATLRLKDSLRRYVFVKGDNAGAIEMGKELQTVLDRVSGEDAPESLAAAAYLGRHLRTDGRFEEADKIFKRIIASSEKLYGEDDIRTLNARWDLAGSLEEQKRFSEAEAIYKDIIARGKATLGAGDPAVLGLGASMAFLKEAEGKDADALLVWKGLLADAREFNEPDAEVIQDYALVVAVRLLENEKYDEAEKLYREVYDTRLRTIGPNQLDTISVQEGLALLYTENGDEEAYARIMREIIDSKLEALGPDSEDVAKDQYRLGLSVASAGDFSAGLVDVVKSLELRKRVLGGTHPLTLESHLMAQTLANRTKDWAKAESMGAEAMAAFDAADKTNAMEHASVIYRLAVSKEELGKKSEALELVTRAAAMAAGRVDEEHWLHSLGKEMIERLQ